MPATGPEFVDYGARVDRVAKFIQNGTKLFLESDRITLPPSKRIKMTAAVNGLLSQVTRANRPLLITLVRRMDGVSAGSRTRASVVSGGGDGVGVEALISAIGMGVMEIGAIAITPANKHIGHMIFQLLHGFLTAIGILSPMFYPDAVTLLHQYAHASMLDCEDEAGPATDNPPEPVAPTATEAADDL